MYDCVVFDMDGTLIDSNKATILALRQVLKEETGKDYSFKQLKSVIGIPGTESLPKFGVKNIEIANLKWNYYVWKYSNLISVYPGIIDMLIQLNDIGIVTGIVTSNNRFEFNRLIDIFKPHNLNNYVRYVICADETNKHKPHPDPLLKFLNISGISHKKTIYIGDTLFDMKCAKAANVQFGWALWGTLEKSTDVDLTFNTPYDIIDIYFKDKSYNRSG